jgi:outer membrane protein OmpA-like peptidoglycan-associated protein
MKIVFIALLALLLTGCAEKGTRDAEVIVLANGTEIDTTSKDQVRQLAEIFLEAQSQNTQQPNRTAQQSLAMLEDLARGQGSGEITIFFEAGSSRLAPKTLEYERLVRFLDYLSLSAHGRNILFVSIGSASAFGSDEINQRLADKRAKAPIPVIEKLLVNIPHDFYKIYAVADLSSQDNIPLEKQKEFQHTRIIAVFEPEQLKQFPAQRVQVKKLTLK